MSTVWHKADIHIHTTHSDGTASVDDVLEYVATQTDLRVIAITDHNTIAGALAARALAPHYGLEVIVGTEISTREGHLLALFVEDDLPAKRPVAETIAAVHAQGGICVAAHPFGGLVPSLGYAGLREQYVAWGIDAIEELNASLWLPHQNRRAAELGSELGLPVCGGSDSHHLPTIGLGYTLFPGTTATDLRHAIISGQTRAGGRLWGWPRIIEFYSLWCRRGARQLASRRLGLPVSLGDQ